MEKPASETDPKNQETSGKTYWETEAKKAFAARDEATRKLREQNEYKTLYEDLKAKTSDYQSLKDQVEAQNRKVQEALGKLEEKLAEGFRPEYEKFIKKLSEAERFEWLEGKLATQKADDQEEAPQLSDVPKAGESGIGGRAAEPQRVPFQNAFGRISGLLEKLRK